MQLLLCHLKAHATCLRLLRMDFKREEVVAHDVPLRVCVQAAYRLLRAMCVGLAPVQMEVATALPTFVAHVPCHSMVRVPLWRYPSSPPVPPQGAPAGQLQLGTPRVGPGHWDPSCSLRCSN